jgi:flagellar biosynthesis/type III secretory pathway M-ring protein FliF/YscJ
MLLMSLAFGLLRAVRRPKPRRETVESPEQLVLPEGSYAPAPTGLPAAEAAPARIDLSPAAQQLAAAQQLSPADREQLAERIRQVAKRDPAATANVLRMWLQDNQT